MRSVLSYLRIFARNLRGGFAIRRADEFWPPTPASQDAHDHANARLLVAAYDVALPKGHSQTLNAQAMPAGAKRDR